MGTEDFFKKMHGLFEMKRAAEVGKYYGVSGSEIMYYRTKARYESMRRSQKNLSLTNPKI